MIVINTNLLKCALVTEALEIGLYKARSLTKNDLMVFLHIHQCVAANRFVGDFNWYRVKVGEIKKLAIQKGGVNLRNKQCILNFLFENADAQTTEQTSNELKSRFLVEYQKLGGNNLRRPPPPPPPPQTIRLRPSSTIQYISDDESDDDDFFNFFSVLLNRHQRPLPQTSHRPSLQDISGEDVQINVDDERSDDDDIEALSSKLSRLQLKTETLAKDLTCVVCYVNKRAITFLDCGHLATCIECSKKLNKTCPVCRTQNSKIQKIFF